MSLKSILQLKAAFYFAAFFISYQTTVFAKQPDTFEEIKKKSSELLIKKQKSDALELVAKYIKNETNKSLIADANDLIVKLSQTFISKEAQDAYESSLNAYLENPKEAAKLNDTCLQLEPLNMECLIQRIRLAYREKNTTLTERTLQTLADFAAGTTVYNWVELYLLKDSPDGKFKDKIIPRKNFEKPNEEGFILNVLEVERSFSAKNFSKARAGIEYLEKNFPDYPENIYFKQKLDSDSAEEKTPAANDSNLLYVTKCKSLSRSVARRFRNDFALCQRGT